MEQTIDDRLDFGARQAEMSARWYENVKAAHGDVDAYIRTRHAAYMDRWREAGRFIKDGSTILDIGGGNLFPELVEMFKSRNFRYNYLDVDPAAVDGSRALADQLALEGASFQQGFNDKLAFPDASFDAIFSSHCVEHSIDLATTFRELNRVLKPNGNLLMAVPFGWESNPEHPYFLGPDEWVSLVEDSGFRIRVAQIGREYAENGEDYFIAATKIGDAPTLFRSDPLSFLKGSYQFVASGDSSIRYEGSFDMREDAAISASPDSAAHITLPHGANEVLPVLSRHPWSGIVNLSNGTDVVRHDLYSWFTYDMPLRIQLTENSEVAPMTKRHWFSRRPQLVQSTARNDILSIKLQGKSAASRWSQFVIKGYLWR